MAFYVCARRPPAANLLDSRGNAMQTTRLEPGTALALLDGPYETQLEAENAKPDVIRWALRHDKLAGYYHYGTADIEPVGERLPVALMRRQRWPYSGR